MSTQKSPVDSALISRTYWPGVSGVTPPQIPQAMRRVKALRAAGFPRQKWLSDFDYSANPNVVPAVVNDLATCDWVKKGEPLCLIGDSGTGKSHLLIGLGTAAAMVGCRVRYALAAKLVSEPGDRLEITAALAGGGARAWRHLTGCWSAIDMMGCGKISAVSRGRR